MHPKKIALLARTAAEDKKAEDPIVLNISKLTSIAHYFLVTHGNSDPHVKAIAGHIRDTFKKKKIPLFNQEGMEAGKWVLLDYGTVIVHVFYRETRQFYNLECLWGEAPTVK